MTPLTLYDYQEECVDKLKTNDKGIVCLPTGTGKTLIQATVIANDIIQYPNQFRLYVINAPRIMLSYQLMKEVYTHLMCSHIEARYMCVHSGGQTDMEDLEKIRTENNDGDTISYSQIESGTSPSKIREMIIKSQNQNLPLVIFSTYNSADRIEQARTSKTIEEVKQELPDIEEPTPEQFGFVNDEWTTKAGEDLYFDEMRKYQKIQFYKSRPVIPFVESIYDKIDIVMNDEAHYLIQERFYNILSILKSNRCYFFTATMVVSKFDKKDGLYDGRGMNNVESYGELLYEMSPLEAIRRGRMVRPRLHFLVSKDTKYTEDDFDKSMGVIIHEAFLHHQNELKGRKPKILVSVRGVGDIKNFLKCEELQKIILYGTDVYAVASDESVKNTIISSDGNNVKVEKDITRQEFLRRLKVDGQDRRKSLIVLHFDILAEGIDVSGFTGILPMRALAKPKFLQTFGRAARLDYNDRIRLESGEMKPDDLDKFIKPYAWVIIPALIHENNDNILQIENIIKELRTEYGLKPYEDIIVSEDRNGIPVRLDILSLNNIENTRNIKSTIEHIEHDIEDEKISMLNDDEFLDYTINDLKS